MIKRMKLYAMAVATLLVSASQAGSQPVGTPAYRWNYYSDAAHQTLVGSVYPVGCNYDDSVIYDQIGPRTSYFDQELVGYCYEGSYYFL